MAGFPANFLLTSLNGTNGFALHGETADDLSGRSVSSAGDVNGDGFDDIIIGAPQASGYSAYTGASSILFGKASGFPDSFNLSSLDGTNGFKLTGEFADDRSGFSATSAGDVNGDGFDDIIIGAAGSDPNGSYSGSTYVVFGKAGGFAAEANLSILGGFNGFILYGENANDRSGYAVSSAGDVNGDGFDDIIVGAQDAYGGTDLYSFYSGISYVVFGKATGFTASLELSSLNGSNGFKLLGFRADDHSGEAVSYAGDFNGDGFDDVIVGAPGADTNGYSNGVSYVVFGKASGFASSLALSALDGLNGFRIDGAAAYDFSGASVSGAGDVNGDGFDDVVIGATGDSGGGSYSGAAYVVFGKGGGFGPSFSLSAINGSNGFKLTGVAAGDQTGVSVSSAGDVNGDGFADLIVGTPYSDTNGNDRGSSYVVFGKAGGFSANVNLATLDGTNGFRIGGVANYDSSGISVSAAGDVNGDGFADLLVGAAFSGVNGDYSGSSYVIFGRATGSIDRIGTDAADILSGGEWDDDLAGKGGDDLIRAGDGDDILNGGADADTLDGGAGDDTIDGGSGNDSINGASGNDTIRAGSGVDTIIGSLGEDNIDGGSGTDTLDFSAFGATKPVSVDLAAHLVTLSDGDTQVLNSIENVNGGAGADTLLGDHRQNVLRGNNGEDQLDGRDGNDTLIGGGSRDVMTGGAGSDIFRYQAVNHSAPGASTRDDITDFTIDPAAGAGFIDRIDVSAIDAVAGTGGNQAFVFIAQAAFTAEGQIRATQSGADTLLSFNTTGTNGSEMQVLLLNVTATTLTAADFIR